MHGQTKDFSSCAKIRTYHYFAVSKGHALLSNEQPINAIAMTVR